ncbi:RGS domain-containing protein [Glomus cerebriforme]|uniref:RGS domain-containing protein n=1 Tax=Glomus cerebriforme TaxID=658196 RepID=A0A397TS23_9GLOM|nr:RGS domain-containing protein [Glomus cerebriforme]
MMSITRKPSLSDILNNETSYPYSLDDFATFLDQTYCLENLEFYMAVRRYTYYAYNFYNYSSSPLSSSIDSDSILESPTSLLSDPTSTYYDDDSSLRGDAPAHLNFLKQKLHDLITTFILPNSPKEINILAETRDDLLTNVFQYNNYHPSIFDNVKDQIYELMESSSFNQFLVEAGNIELRMSSESESCQEDSDHSSVGGKVTSTNNNTKNNKHTRRFSGLKLKEKYRKLIKTNASKSRNSFSL